MSKNIKSFKKTAQRYAKALFELINDDVNKASIDGQIQEIILFIENNNDFKRITMSPLLTPSNQENIIADLFSYDDDRKVKIDVLLFKFISSLARNGRLAILENIILEYKELVSKNKNEELVTITSALALDEDVKEELKNNLTTKIGKSIILEYKLDPSIIGGIILQIGSKLIDCSVKYKLTKLNYAMKGAN